MVYSLNSKHLNSVVQMIWHLELVSDNASKFYNFIFEMVVDDTNIYAM